MAQYLAEVHLDGLTFTLPAPAAATNGQWLAVAFNVSLRDSASAPQGAQLQIDCRTHSFGGGPTSEWQTLQQEISTGVLFAGPLIDYTLALGFVTTEANGNNGAAFLAPPSGTLDLSILIDDTAQTVTFAGPLGSHAHTFAAMGWAAGSVSQVNLLGLGAALNVADVSQDLALSVAFYSFYLSVGGERTMGGQLGTIQPGSFNINPWVSDAGALIPTDGRTESRLLGQLHYFANSAAFSFADGMHADYNTGLGDVDLLLTALRHPDEGVLLYARVVKQAIDAVEVGASRDQGHTWTTLRVGQTSGRAYVSPSLATSPDGTLNLFVNDRSVKFTRWFKSYSFGMDWVEVSALLPVLPWVTITHPKVFTLANGFFLVSYNATGHHFIQLFDSSPSAGIGTPHDFGANPGGFDVYPTLWQDDLGRVYSTVAPAGGSEEEDRSVDFGSDWDQVYSAPLSTRQVVMAKDKDSPFLWKAYQDGSGNLSAYPSADAGLTLARAAALIEAGVAQQYVGLAVLPLSAPVVVFQFYFPTTDHWLIDTRLSLSLGGSWSPA